MMGLITHIQQSITGNKPGYTYFWTNQFGPPKNFESIFPPTCKAALVLTIDSMIALGSKNKLNNVMVEDVRIIFKLVKNLSFLSSAQNTVQFSKRRREVGQTCS